MISETPGGGSPSGQAPPTAGGRPGTAPPPTPVNLATQDLPCLNCGYNLRGLSPEGSCPECGTPVARSLQGNLLVYSAPEYLASLHRGLVLILLAALVEVGELVLFIVGSIVVEAALDGWGAGMLRSGHELAKIGAACFSLLGWWLFSAPDPAILGNDRGDRPRRVIRIMVIIVAIVTVLNMFATHASSRLGSMRTLESVGDFVGLACWISRFFASMQYIRWLAPRLPSPILYARAQTYMWLLPVIYLAGFCFVFVGPLVAMAMNLLMLNDIRAVIRDIRARQVEPAF